MKQPNDDASSKVANVWASVLKILKSILIYSNEMKTKYCVFKKWFLKTLHSFKNTALCFYLIATYISVQTSKFA